MPQCRPGHCIPPKQALQEGKGKPQCRAHRVKASPSSRLSSRTIATGIKGRGQAKKVDLDKTPVTIPSPGRPWTGHKGGQKGGKKAKGDKKGGGKKGQGKQGQGQQGRGQVKFTMPGKDAKGAGRGKQK